MAFPSTILIDSSEEINLIKSADVSVPVAKIESVYDTVLMKGNKIEMFFKIKQQLETSEATEKEWWKELDALDAVSITIPLLIISVGFIDLLAHIPVLFGWLFDLMLMGGGASLLFTALLLAKRLGIKK